MEQTLSMGPRFSILHRSFMKRLDARLSEKGLTGVQFFVLRALERLEKSEPEEVNQRDLEKAAHVTHPTMTEIVKRLEKQGFVVCSPSARDRRYKCIRSTAKAGALLREMVELDNRIFESLCRGLTQEEINSLLSITDKMLKNAFDGCEKGSENGCD